MRWIVCFLLLDAPLCIGTQLGPYVQVFPQCNLFALLTLSSCKNNAAQIYSELVFHYYLVIMPLILYALSSKL